MRPSRLAGLSLSAWHSSLRRTPIACRQGERESTTMWEFQPNSAVVLASWEDVPARREYPSSISVVCKCSKIKKKRDDKRVIATKNIIYFPVFFNQNLKTARFQKISCRLCQITTEMTNRSVFSMNFFQFSVFPLYICARFLPSLSTKNYILCLNNHPVA